MGEPLGPLCMNDLDGYKSIPTRSHGEAMEWSLVLASQGIEPILDLTTDIPLVKADPELITQCLIKLVKNALEAMPHGGMLKIAITRKQNCAIVAIADTGCGDDLIGHNDMTPQAWQDVEPALEGL